MGDTADSSKPETAQVSDNQVDNFVVAYELLEKGAEMYARLYGLDEFTLWNHVAGEVDKVRFKMYEGYIEKPLTYSIVEAVKTNEDGKTVLAMRKGNRSKDVILDGDPVTVADLSDLDDDTELTDVVATEFGGEDDRI